MQQRFSAKTLKTGLLLIALTLGSVSSLAEPVAKSMVPAASKSPAPTTRELMQHFLTELTALKKFFISEEKFSDPKNSGEISEHLAEFAKYAKLAKHDPQLQRNNFKFSQQVLETYILDTERLFRVGNKSFARWQLGSTVSVCMSCHTQMPAGNRLFSEFAKTDTFSSKFDQAEFLFATRAFDKAVPVYENVIADFPLNKYEPREVEAAFERQLVYFIRLRRNPAEAVTRFKAELENKNIPTYIRDTVTEWISSLEKLQKNPLLDPAKASNETILSFAKDNLIPSTSKKAGTNQDPNLVTYLYVSGVLYEYLQLNPNSKSVPDLLYYLAICDRYVSNNFVYSLADLYLRECIIKYPELPIAKKCYKEYEAETILGYTGSAGTNIPGDVNQDLRQLKALVDSGGKLKLNEH